MDGLEWRNDLILVTNARRHNSMSCDLYILGKYKGNVTRCRNRLCKWKIVADKDDSISRWACVKYHTTVYTQEMLEQYCVKGRVLNTSNNESLGLSSGLRISEVRQLDCHVSDRAASRFAERNTPKPQNKSPLQLVVLDDPSVKFLLDRSDNNNALIFGDLAAVKKMAVTDILFIDGTFSSCCKLYSQLYIIHMKDCGVYRPVLFCFLPNKNR